MRKLGERHQRLDRGGVRIGRIGAGIGQHVAVQGDKPGVSVECAGHGQVHVSAVEARHQVVAPVLGPAHRAAVAQRSLARPVTGLAAVGCVVLALIAFLPPWYAARLTSEALQGASPDAPSSLRWAARLDPVSTAPLVAEAQLAPSVSAQLGYLRKAARREPRVLQTQYFLGSVLLNAGRKAEARRVFEHANSLDPGNQAVARALRLAR